MMVMFLAAMDIAIMQHMMTITQQLAYAAKLMS